MEIHYRWRALHGRPLRRLYSEKRSGTEVVVVEGELGAAIVVAAWMFDPAICAAMKIGPPLVSVGALIDLHRLLTEHGFRRSFPDDDHVIRETRDEERVTADCEAQSPTPVQHGAGFDRAQRGQRRRTQRGDIASGSSPDGGRRGGDRGERR